MSIYSWIGIILCGFSFLVIVDIICAGFFSFNFHAIFHPERYGIILPEPQRSAKDYDTIQKGKKIASQKKVTIAILARDVSHIFDKALKRIEAIGSLFGDYEVIIFENDSTDRSRELFKGWITCNPRVNLLECEDLGYKDCKFNTTSGYKLGVSSLDRMNLMSFFRNRYIEHFCKKSDSDYLLVYDFDLNGGISLEGILHSIGCEDLWDAVFARGLSRFPPFGLTSVMYDGLAYVSKGSEDLGIVSRFFELNSLPKEGLVEVIARLMEWGSTKENVFLMQNTIRLIKSSIVSMLVFITI